ncbi:PilN domain-containing protein [Demequina aurantiaca]|uniref:PilN domain-containing protein n=1 Tax=Demequina aurantiaca TaxID=676200 RepID=UPI00078434C5|nr:hypothetical protein [Demequina aurantiaca]
MSTVTQDTPHAAVTPLLGPTQGKTGKLGLPDRPQVNLLPAEVTNQRELVIVKRRTLWTIVAAVLVCVLAYGALFLLNSSADARNEEALARADQLTLEKKKYSPVIQVIKDISDVRESRSFVLANEVNWTSYVYALAAVLPEGVTIDSISVASIGPGADLVVGVDELTEDAIGVITFEATSPTLPVASEWIDTLESVPGLVDANLQSSELKDEEGNVTYAVSATVQVTSEALANRTFPDDEPAEDAAATDDAAADDSATDTTDEG